MSQAYTPGLVISPKTSISKRRELPLPGKCLVAVGEKVSANTAVLSAELPGELSIVRVASRMGFDPQDVAEHITVSVGNSVKKGDLLCSVRTFFGLFKSELQSSAEGVVEFFTPANAHIGIRAASIPLEVNAYISGTVTEIEEGKSVVIQTNGALLQGIFGVGGECHGNILPLPIPVGDVVTREMLEQYVQQHGKVALSGKILFGGAQFDLSALEFAGVHGTRGVVTGSIDAKTLKNFVGYEIGVSITGDEKVPYTLMVTEGFGKLPFSERVLELVSAMSGRFASMNGATQVRAGAMRPEVIVPEEQTAQETFLEERSRALDIGSRVRIIRVPYFGQFGTVVSLPHEPEKIPSGALVRVLYAKLESGEEVVVPRANVELT